jgi:proteasome lid subunit RPN8/RPN11
MAMKLPGSAREAMVAHARSEAPNEACGLLAADEEDAVTMVYCLTNLDASPVAYSLDPEEHYWALRHAEGRGWRLAGVYHSHPRGPASPSATDVARALEPEWVYVIITLDDEPSVRGYRISGGGVLVEPLEEVA